MIRIMREPKSNYPRDLEEDFKIFARSTPEVFEALGAIVSRVALDRELKFKGRFRPKKAQVLNALILYFETLSSEDQIRAINVGMGKLNDILKRPLSPGSGDKAKEAEESQPDVITGDSGPKTTKKRGRSA